MKKNLWMLGAALVALTSCTQNEVLEIPESRMIGFDPFVGKSTRVATQINQAQSSSTLAEDNLYQFWVYGSEDGNSKFEGTDDNAKVYYSTATNGFTYQKHAAWNFGSTYNFAAYSNGNQPLTDDEPININTSTTVTSTNKTVEFSDISESNVIVGSQLKFKDYTVSDLDLLAAITKTTKLPETQSEIEDVPFTFQHMLSLIDITLQNNSKDVYMQIKDVTFNAIKTDNCVYKIKGENRTITWENISDTEEKTEKKGTYIFKGTKDGILNTNDVNSYIAPGQTFHMIYFVIPQSNQKDALKTIPLEIQSYLKKDDNTYELANPNANETSKLILNLAINNINSGIGTTDDNNIDHKIWQPGYVYKYTGALTGNEYYIHFDVNAVNDWKNNAVNVNGSTVK